MKLYCCQFDICWEAKEINFEKVRTLLEGNVPTPGSLVVLPEMAFTGFSMNVELVAEDEPQRTESFLTDLAKRFGVYLIAGLVTRCQNGRGENKAVFVAPDGGVGEVYQKMRLFSPGGEHLYFQRGDTIKRFSWPGGCVVPLICYDLRFPELFRAALPLGAELYVIIANWPRARDDHWITLLRARAIENQAFVAGVNRCGQDPNHDYAGRSMIIGPDGRILAEAGTTDEVISAEVSWKIVRECRVGFPGLKDRYGVNNRCEIKAEKAEETEKAPKAEIFDKAEKVERNGYKPRMNAVDKFASFANTDAVRQNLKRKSVRGVLFMVSGGGADLIIRLVSTFLLARLLSPNDFGLVAMVVSVTGIAEQFSELGLSTATIQCRELNHQQVTNLFWINVGAGCLFCLVICGLAPGIAKFYHDPELVLMTLAISTTFIWGGLTVQHQALLSRQLKQGHLAVIRLVASFLSLILAVGLAIGHFGVWALAWREVTRALFVAGGMWMFCHWIPGWPRRNANIKGLLHYGSHLTISQLALACMSQLDRFLIGRYFGASPLGLYRQAQQLILAPIEQLRIPLYSVASPSLSILQTDRERYRRYYQRIILVISLATMPVGLFIAIYAEEITHVLLGPKWVAATVFLRIFGVVACLKPCLDTTSVVMLTYGLSKRMLTLSIIYNVLFAGLMCAGMYWGAVGVALSNIVAILLLMVPMLYFSLRETPVTVAAFLDAVSTPAIASAIMAGVLLSIHGPMAQYGMTASLFSGVVAAAVVYPAAVLLSPRGRNELSTLLAAVFSSLRRREQPNVTISQVESVSAV